MDILNAHCGLESIVNIVLVTKRHDITKALSEMISLAKFFELLRVSLYEVRQNAIKGRIFAA